jgi:hypothetical protein
MGKRSVGTFWGLVLLVAGATGCTSNKGNCETYCKWMDRCGGGDVSCSDTDLEDCADVIENRGGDCEDAFADFADCLDDNDKCEDAASDCLSEAEAVTKQCDKD